MQRIRLFRRGETGGYQYEKTVLLPDGADVPRGLKAAGAGPGDIAYWGDIFFRLQVSTDLGWVQLEASTPELRGLYSQAVTAEREEAEDSVW